MLPPWFYRVWGAVTTVPLFKTSQRQETKLRPVGVMPGLVRTIQQFAARQNRQILQSYLEPQQLALSPAGAHKLVHMVRMALEANRDWVCVKLDVSNAHSSVARAAVLETLEEEPSLRHMAWHFATSMGAPTGLETGGRMWGEAGDGLVQGAPGSSGYFCVSWHPEVRQLDAEVSADGGAARLGNDDGYIFGPAATVFSALARFERRIYDRCFLVLQREKTEVFTWGDLPPETPDDPYNLPPNIWGFYRPNLDNIWGIYIIFLTIIVWPIID